MSSEAKSSTKTAWLHMLREGGRWTTTEMQHVIESDLCGARGTLNSMAAAGSVKRYEPKEPGASITFGVTLDCKVPMGVTITELAQVGILKKDPA